MLEEFYPTHILNRIIDQSSEAASGGAGEGVGVILGHLARGIPGQKHVGISERGVNVRRSTALMEAKFATVEEWWDSKGLPTGIVSLSLSQSHVSCTINVHLWPYHIEGNQCIFTNIRKKT